MTTDDVTLWLRVANAVLALTSVAAFAAVCTYRAGHFDNGFRSVLTAVAGLIGAVAVTSAWRAANGHPIVPAAILFVALLLLCGALVRDFVNRRPTP